ncbi:MAG: hypothetical protein AAGE94_25555, partial [Acidobacteriota bacterium]
SPVWDEVLRPRLNALRNGGSLDLRMLMISHIDDDHVNGIVELLQTLREADLDGREMPVRIRTLWHNAFDDLVGEGAPSLEAAAFAAMLPDDPDAGLGVASPAELVAGVGSADPQMSRSARMVAASVPQGRTCRSLANAMGIPINAGAPEDGALVSARRGQGPVDLGHGLAFHILGPSERRIQRVRKRWLEIVGRQEQHAAAGAASDSSTAEAAEIFDSSVFNQSSLIVLASLGERRVLLPGDARGDDILKGAKDAGLLNDGRLEVDVMKLPQHGSDRHVETDFFRRVRARHYLVSADGRHGNPEISTLQMLVEARRGDREPYTLHFTHRFSDFRPGYPVSELRCILDCYRRHGHPVEVREPNAADAPTILHLADLPVGG